MTHRRHSSCRRRTMTWMACSSRWFTTRHSGRPTYPWKCTSTHTAAMPLACAQRPIVRSPNGRRWSMCGCTPLAWCRTRHGAPRSGDDARDGVAAVAQSIGNAKELMRDEPLTIASKQRKHVVEMVTQEAQFRGDRGHVAQYFDGHGLHGEGFASG